MGREREYETILWTIPDEVYTLDAGGYFTRIVSPVDAEVSTLGYRPDEVIGEHISLVLDESDIATGERIIESCNGCCTRTTVTTCRSGWRRYPQQANENHIALLLPDEDYRFQGTVGVLAISPIERP
ncbi:PAS domain-containing protein [Natrinema gelatinilyticum]|uniref:PAS domain-containing protein n=1 Tax=Natrinema gelatinilyticum TaxID=2961571 RepID=UPI0020C3DCD2|nr:PAS domain-containing protein [Natrinema gelatinilyticum]